MKIRTKENAGIINFEHKTYAVLDKIRAMPGRKRWKGDLELWFELTIPNIKYVLFAFPGAEWDDEGPLRKLERMQKQEEETRLLKGSDIQLPPEFYKFPFKTKPREHQAKAFFLSRDKDVFGLFMDMGTGKTHVILNTAAYQYAEGKIDTLLVVAPNGVHRQWVKEQVPAHLPEWCKAKAVYWTSSTTKTWQREWDEVLAHKDGLRIFAMNVDAFSQKEGRGVKAARQVLASGRCMLTIDESSKIKSFSNRTKQLLSLAPLAPVRRVMSGSPITQGVEDLYTQMKFLDDGILGFSTKAAFEDYYCVRRAVPGAPSHVTKIVAYQNMEELRERLEGFTFRVTKDECLDLPDKVFMTREVELTPAQKKMYRQARDEAVLDIGGLGAGKMIDTQRAITKLVKLQQIICGFVRDEDGIDHTIESNRVAACLEAFEEAQGKVIIWTRFANDVKILSEALCAAGHDFAEYHGALDAKKNDANLHRFQTSPDCKGLLANSQKGGIGLNLAMASTSIYYSNDFNAETRWQSEDRTHRDGQRNVCIYVDLVARGTIDVKILSALRDKKNVADSVLDVRKMLEEALED